MEAAPGLWAAILVESYKIESPSDIVGIKKYLGSGLIKGIGAKYATRIVEKFDMLTLEVIDKQPERLNEIEGLGKKRIAAITTMLVRAEINPPGDDLFAGTRSQSCICTKNL